ncbi:MAG: exodeoxyribonuclease VII small subunit [Coriobacteriales bacterium]
MSEETTKPVQVDELSFREGLEELAAIVRSLESNQVELEQSIESYERGVALLASLQKRLNEAQQKVTVLMGELEPENDDSIDTTLS